MNRAYERLLMLGVCAAVLGFWGYQKLVVRPDPLFIPVVYAVKSGKKDLNLVEFKVNPGSFARYLKGQMDDKFPLDKKRREAEARKKPLTSQEQLPFVRWFEYRDVRVGDPWAPGFTFPKGETQRFYEFNQADGPFGEDIALFLRPNGSWGCKWMTYRMDGNKTVDHGECS